MNSDLLRKTLHDSEAGAATFPDVVRTLILANCEGYLKDLASGTVTFYMADGATHTERLSLTLPAIPETFDQPALVDAIRAAQRDEIRYPEFILRAVRAGTAAYRVCITGARAVYLGRKGDLHVEHFPQAKS